MFSRAENYIPDRIEKLLREEGQIFTTDWQRGQYTFFFKTNCMLWVTPRGGLSWLRRFNFKPQKLADDIEVLAAGLSKKGRFERRQLRKHRKRYGL